MDPRVLGKNFVTAFSSAAQTRLRTAVQVHACEIGEQTLPEFLQTMEKSSCCYVLAGAFGGDADAPYPLAVLGLSPLIAYTMVDTLLGGTDAEAFLPGRALTAIERQLLRQIAFDAARCLSAVWPGSPRPELRLAEGEFRAGEILACWGDVEGVAVSAAISLRGCVGALRLCVPGWEVAAGTGAGRLRIEGPLEVTASLQATIDPRELQDLSAGDIVLTDSAADGEVVVRVGGIPKFVGRLCASNGRRAVTILRRLNEPPP